MKYLLTLAITLGLIASQCLMLHGLQCYDGVYKSASNSNVSPRLTTCENLLGSSDVACMIHQTYNYGQMAVLQSCVKYSDCLGWAANYSYSFNYTDYYTNQTHLYGNSFTCCLNNSCNAWTAPSSPMNNATNNQLSQNQTLTGLWCYGRESINGVVATAYTSAYPCYTGDSCYYAVIKNGSNVSYRQGCMDYSECQWSKFMPNYRPLNALSDFECCQSDLCNRIWANVSLTNPLNTTAASSPVTNKCLIRNRINGQEPFTPFVYQCRVADGEYCATGRIANGQAITIYQGCFHQAQCAQLQNTSYYYTVDNNEYSSSWQCCQGDLCNNFTVNQNVSIQPTTLPPNTRMCYSGSGNGTANAIPCYFADTCYITEMRSGEYVSIYQGCTTWNDCIQWKNSSSYNYSMSGINYSYQINCCQEDYCNYDNNSTMHQPSQSPMNWNSSNSNVTWPTQLPWNQTTQSPMNWNQTSNGTIQPVVMTTQRPTTKPTTKPTTRPPVRTGYIACYTSVAINGTELLSTPFSSSLIKDSGYCAFIGIFQNNRLVYKLQTVLTENECTLWSKYNNRFIAGTNTVAVYKCCSTNYCNTVSNPTTVKPTTARPTTPMSG